MSKTDKTKPWWVRVEQHHSIPEHDHRNGVCDLPDSYRDNVWSGQHCRWSTQGIWYSCCGGCGCHLCADQHGRKRTRRKERQGARQLNRRYAQGAEW